eukprot:GHVP01050269.1.p1 GENE.GHVP01050269.1~~GHVP01050269.1.p1  ORF type:complete len:519 (-),score=63.15 GHVP01050269.1:177-1733(-)
MTEDNTNTNKAHSRSDDPKYSYENSTDMKDKEDNLKQMKNTTKDSYKSTVRKYDRSKVTNYEREYKGAISKGNKYKKEDHGSVRSEKKGEGLLHIKDSEKKRESLYRAGNKIKQEDMESLSIDLGLFVSFDEISHKKPRENNKHRKYPLEVLAKVNPLWWDANKTYSTDPSYRLSEEICEMYYYLYPTPSELTKRALYIEKTCKIIQSKYKNLIINIQSDYNGEWDYINRRDSKDNKKNDGKVRQSNITLPTDSIEISLEAMANGTEVNRGLVLEEIGRLLIEPQITIRRPDKNGESGEELEITTKEDIRIRIGFLDLYKKEVKRNLISWKNIEIFSELYVLIKVYLNVRHLDNKETGGICYYTVAIMVKNFISLHPEIQMNRIHLKSTIGILFIEFLELYGVYLNTNNVYVLSNSYKPKPIKKTKQGENISVLSSYTNPLINNAISTNGSSATDSSNNNVEKDLSKNAFQWFSIKSAFENSYYTLIFMLRKYRKLTGVSKKFSVLSTAINDGSFIFE